MSRRPSLSTTTKESHRRSLLPTHTASNIRRTSASSDLASQASTPIKSPNSDSNQVSQNQDEDLRGGRPVGSIDDSLTPAGEDENTPRSTGARNSNSNGDVGDGQSRTTRGSSASPTPCSPTGSNSTHIITTTAARTVYSPSPFGFRAEQSKGYPRISSGVPQDPDSPVSVRSRQVSGRVIAGLQGEVDDWKIGYEKLKAELRAKESTIKSLENKLDGMERSRDRYKVETDGLNSVVARKERQLQETLERVHTAELEAINLKRARSEELANTATLKTSLARAEARALRSENEYTSLRSATDGLKAAWTKELEGVKAECAVQIEAQSLELDRKRSLKRTAEEELKSAQESTERIRKDRAEIDDSFEDILSLSLDEVRSSLARSEGEDDVLRKEVHEITRELDRIRKLVQAERPTQDHALLESQTDPIQTHLFSDESVESKT
ncbi:hypothetical protein [Phaffia rhodozyma]|uniref:SWI5-dependent HO expression protein 3 n=1 Tax=Phaffia rhodozyma TaxID=264483 RepID=A0A0F7SKT1_PHARH|nr:hypothetical protein [Phaffia rhodozyma]